MGDGGTATGSLSPTSAPRDSVQTPNAPDCLSAVTSKQRDPLKSLLSISLDLAGSTDIKQAIILQSEGQPGHREQLYDEYLKLLFSVEQTFYEFVKADDILSVDRLFLVKTIGDEFWYAYEVDNLDVEDLRRTASLLMDVVLSTLQKGLLDCIPFPPSR